MGGSGVISAGRVRAVVRVRAWQRVRRETAVWLVIGALLPGFSLPIPTPTASERVAAILLLALAFATLALALGLWRDPPDGLRTAHLPVREVERTWATWIADEVTGVGGVLVLLGTVAAGRAFFAARPAGPWSPASWGAGVVGVAAAALFVAHAPALIGGWRREASAIVWRVVGALAVEWIAVAAVWVSIGPSAAVVASFGWWGARRWLAPGVGVDSCGVSPAAGVAASTWQEPFVPDARRGGSVRLGRGGVGERVRAGARLAPWVFVGTVAIGLLMRAFDAAFPSDDVPVWWLALVWTDLVTTNHSLTRPLGGGGAHATVRERAGDDLVRFQRHLPIAPALLIDVPWLGALRHGLLITCGLVIFRGVEGVLSWPLVLASVLAGFGTAMLPPVIVWVRAIALTRRDAGREGWTRTIDLLALMVAFGLALAATTRVPPPGWLRGTAVAVGVELVIAIGLRSWARRRWVAT